MHALITRIIEAFLRPLRPTRPALTGPGGMTPEQLLSFHRRTFGDARMEAGDEADEPDAGDDTGGENDDVDLESVIKDLGLTPGQIKGRLEASRKWESRAKAQDTVDRKDYETVVAERDSLRQDAMSEAEKQIEAARSEGLLEGRTAASKEAATALFRQSLTARGKDADAIDTLQGMFNPAAYLDDKGVLDHERLTKAIDTLAPAQQERQQNNQWPDMGQGKRHEANTASVSAGRNLYDARNKK